MDWLKDKKNQPIVIGIAAVVLIGAIVGLLFQFGVLGGSGGSTSAATPPPPPGISVPGSPPIPGGPGAAPGGLPGNGGPLSVRPPGAPAGPLQPAAAKPGTPAGPTPPRTAANVDPFSVPGVLVPKTQTAKPPSVSALLPFVDISRLAPKSDVSPITGHSGGGDITPELSTTQRMSGVLFTDKGIVGLLETNGQTQQVYPGDTTTDGTARVISIQSDGMILRRQIDNRLVRVPLSSVATGPSVPSNPAVPDNPAGPPGSGNPGSVNQDNGDNN